MCNNCKNPSCYGCNYTYQNYPCPQFPPPPGPKGDPGPTGPQGPPAPLPCIDPNPLNQIQGTGAPGNCLFVPPSGQGTCPCPLSIIQGVPVTGITQLAVAYNVTATDDVILVDSRLGVVDIFLLPANNPLIFNRKLVIKDAFGSSGLFPITIQPAGLDTIDFPGTVIDLFTTVGAYGSIELVSNQTNGYNII